MDFLRPARGPPLPALQSVDGRWSAHLAAFNGGEFYSPETSAEAEIRAVHELARQADEYESDPVGVGLSALRAISLAVQGGAALEASSL